MSENINYLNKENPHILMITNHGVHEWQIRPGLADTGGQNIFVNQFTDTLSEMGFRITIVNRGGYSHPETGKNQSGIKVKDGKRRIFYLDDGRSEFVRKEDMHEQIDALAIALSDFLLTEEKFPDLIISHYWDGAAVAVKTLKILDADIPHIWVPHSLGAIKRRKTTGEENLNLRMSERIEVENRIVKQLRTVVSTSEAVKNSLLTDYSFKGEILFIPPCIDDRRYFPFKVEPGHPVYEVLSGGLEGSAEVTPGEFRLITEVSRTDRTKRKDILIKAFIEIMDDFPEVILAVTIDRESKTGSSLIDLINSKGAAGRISVLGSVWEFLPALYNITDIYCSPSVMEGFGMSVQEAAACRTAVVASELIPFAVEYLSEAVAGRDNAGALIVKADDIKGFSQALSSLLADSRMRAETAENAYKLTVPYFTWPRMLRQFFRELDSYDGKGAADASF